MARDFGLNPMRLRIVFMAVSVLPVGLPGITAYLLPGAIIPADK